MSGQVVSLKDLFVHELKDLLYAEKRLVRELPRMARNARDEDLRSAIEEHTEQTREQVTRLERIFEIIGVPARAERCEGMEGLLREAEELMESAETPAVRDAAMIAGAQRVEHYEIAAYGCARAFAQQLGLQDAVTLLDQTIAEEGAADKALSDIAERRVNPDALNARAESDESFQEESAESTGERRRSGRSNGARSSRGAASRRRRTEQQKRGRSRQGSRSR